MKMLVGVVLLLQICLVCAWITRPQHLSPFSLTALKARGFGTKKSVHYTGDLRPGKLSPPRIVPGHIVRPDYAYDGIVRHQKESWRVNPTPPSDIEKMRVAGCYAREVLDAAVWAIKRGEVRTTDDIDAIVHEETIRRNCYPSTLNYGGFPRSMCTSLNEVVCHGIPDSTPLRNGDIINLDVTVYFEGVHGDCSETVFVGNATSTPVQDLVRTTFAAWQAAIHICKPGVPYNEIGGVIEDIISKKGYSTVRECAGHGINSIFHTSPLVLHFKNDYRCDRMAEGHTFTIEPIVCLGRADSTVEWDDGWTVTTVDGLPTAQFEHTLLITKTGVDVLTKKLPTSPKFFWEK